MLIYLQKEGQLRFCSILIFSNQLDFQHLGVNSMVAGTLETVPSSVFI